MKNFTQKFIGLFALVFAMSYTVIAQSSCMDSEGSALGLSCSQSIDVFGCSGLDFVGLTISDLCPVSCGSCTPYIPPCDHNSYDVCLYLSPDGQLTYNSVVEIAGIQGQLDGGSIISVYGGGMSSDNDFDFMVNQENNMFVGYSMGMNYIQPGEGVLLNLNYESDGADGACLNNVELANYGGSTVNYSLQCNLSGESVFGCTDTTAFNYNADANTDDGSCIAVVNGCMDDNYVEYNSAANTDNGTCVTLIVEGCTDDTALNYDSASNTDDGSCVAIVNGCTDASAFNYDLDANTDDGSCIPVIVGCIDESAFNYSPEANSDDGSCLPKIFGCTDQSASNFNSIANTDDGLCIPYVQLPEGWSMFGYTCLESLDVVNAFSEISTSIEIIKDEWGLAYLPAWGFSAFDNLEFGEGYQIKMIENVTGFEFCGTNWLEDGVSQADLDVAVDAAVEQVEISYADHTPPLDLQIGDYYAGGIVFQINENGSGLVAATNDHGPYTWKQATTIASQYIAEGYSGWHVPSIEELELMYNTIGQGGDNSGGFENTTYWSSSPFQGGSGWSYSGYGADLDFSTGTIYGSQMLPWFNNYGQQYAYEASLKVRLVRAF